jgi:predicted MPP superfamily phosphohydrolase
MFGTILISIATLMHVYVFWRTASVPFIKLNVSRKTLITAGVLLWAILFLGRFFGHHGTGSLAMILEFCSMTWLAVLFLTFIPLLLIDIITLFGFLMPRISPWLRGGALLVGIILSAIALFQGMRPPVIQKYDVSLAGLPADMDGTVIVALSDMHLGTQLGKQWLADRIAQVNALQPDLVVLLGDIFEGHGAPENHLIAEFDKISAPFGIWAVPGNHEFHGNGKLDHFNGTNFRLLTDRWTEVSPGLVLAGVEDLTHRHRNGRTGDPISQALAGRPAGATILLSHTPWQTETAANAGVGLMLSGHTHGGQIWPFGYLVRMRYPLLAGRYEVAGMTMIVSRGTGTWGPRMRLWHPGEILQITLQGL